MDRTRQITIVASLIVFCGGCSLVGAGGDADGKATTGRTSSAAAEDFPSLEVGAICSLAAGCCSASALLLDAAVCQGSYPEGFQGELRGVTPEILASGNVIHHAAAEADCLARIQALGCADLGGPSFRGAIAACYSVYTGALAAGDACSASIECQPGNFCNAGTCAPLRPPGAPCADSDECSYRGRGNVCDVNGVCASKAADGEGCASSSDCSSALCDGGTCVPSIVDPFSAGRCTAMGATPAAPACGAAGARLCDPGEACGGDADCTPGILCNGGICDGAPPPARRGDAYCTAGNVCNAGICGAAVPASGTGHLFCGYSASVVNPAGMTSTVSTTCSATQRMLVGNGVPDHVTGAFPNPGNPNTISAQNINFTATLNPTLTGATRSAVVTGYAMNSIKLEPGTAESYQNAGVWRIEALGQSYRQLGTDSSNAHVQPNGAYHYHGMPEEYMNVLGKGAAMTLVGFAVDGFPVYARYGYDIANDPASAVRAINSSFRIKATPDAGRPSTALVAMGTFTQDFEYVAGLGDLDECNGRLGVTPEFPAGIYHYFITDGYPYIQRCLKG